METVQMMLVPRWITGVVHASVDVDVGAEYNTYVLDDPLIAVPPTKSDTAMV